MMSGTETRIVEEIGITMSENVIEAATETFTIGVIDHGGIDVFQMSTS